jgi:hypothetical protein
VPYWKKLIAGKIVVASIRNSAGKINVDIRVIAVQTEVKKFSYSRFRHSA